MYGERIMEPVMLEYLPDGESMDIRNGSAADFIARKDPSSMG